MAGSCDAAKALVLAIQWLVANIDRVCTFGFLNLTQGPQVLMEPFFDKAWRPGEIELAP